jgi:soluble lytic murein transglycosylase-like protein
MRVAQTLIACIVCGLMVTGELETRHAQELKTYQDTVDFLAFPDTLPVWPENIDTKNRLLDVVEVSYFPPPKQQDLEVIATYLHIYARQYDVPENLMIALVAQESAFNPRAVSVTDARGLGQLVSSTARQTAKELHLKTYDLFDIRTNLQMTAWYLAKLIRVFHGSVNLAIYAYSGGPETVVQVSKGLAQYSEESLDHHQRVMAYYNLLNGRH